MLLISTSFMSLANKLYQFSSKDSREFCFNPPPHSEQNLSEQENSRAMEGLSLGLGTISDATRFWAKFRKKYYANRI